MAGSLAHILNDDGTFRGLDLIDSEGDKWAALAECHQIIAVLLRDETPPDTERQHAAITLRNVCELLGFPVPTVEDAPMTGFSLGQVVVPAIQHELHGAESVYKPDAPDAPKDWLVWSNEHRAWWAPNRQGYTSVIEQAGRYTKAEADQICQGANQCLSAGTTNEMAVKAPEELQ